MKFHECAAGALTTGQLWRQKGNRYYWFGLQYDKRVEKYSENHNWEERNCRRYSNSNGLFITADELNADDWQMFDPPSDWRKEACNVWVPPAQGGAPKWKAPAPRDDDAEDFKRFGLK